MSVELPHAWHRMDWPEVYSYFRVALVEMPDVRLRLDEDANGLRVHALYGGDRLTMRVTSLSTPKQMAELAGFFAYHVTYMFPDYEKRIEKLNMTFRQAEASDVGE